MTAPTGPITDLDAAYDRCAAITRRHTENFTVASWFLPRDKRRHFYAIYAYCRGVDDLGDEAAGDRLALLDEWERRLSSCYGPDAPSEPVFLALQATIRQLGIPPEPFLRLIEANRRDQWVNSYPTYADLLDYCTYSANPVGHLVLAVFGYRDARRRGLADHICTALQLTNFWQDVARDHAMGRIYLPLEDLDRFGYSPEDLAAGRVNDAFRRLMAFEVDRARLLFAAGAPLADVVGRDLRLDLRLFSLGGLAVLAAIERQGYDVLSRRPTIPTWRRAALVAQAFVETRLGKLPLAPRTGRTGFLEPEEGRLLRRPLSDTAGGDDRRAGRNTPSSPGRGHG
ncbi:MAG TPA: squalene synthase HpnC [Dehalococcoidia bacterium]|nr:squalene synthase HpnC [Dehalococcoidia bacterium]